MSPDLEREVEAIFASWRDRAIDQCLAEITRALETPIDEGIERLFILRDRLMALKGKGVGHGR